jgi:hypothetical protein
MVMKKGQINLHIIINLVKTMDGNEKRTNKSSYYNKYEKRKNGW